MSDILSKLDGGEILGLCGILLGMLGLIGGITVAITKVVAAHYRRTQLDDMKATLKMEMIQRGMSPEDIERVLAARMGTQPCRKSKRDWQWWPDEQKSRS